MRIRRQRRGLGRVEGGGGRWEVWKRQATPAISHTGSTRNNGEEKRKKKKDNDLKNNTNDKEAHQEVTMENIYRYQY